jgi:hypothetical protein
MTSESIVYIRGLDNEIFRLQEKGKRFLYRPDEKLDEDTVQEIRLAFGDTSKYILEMKKCVSCLNSWDITIELL